jgi:hypothetical protein
VKAYCPSPRSGPATGLSTRPQLACLSTISSPPSSCSPLLLVMHTTSSSSRLCRKVITIRITADQPFQSHFLPAFNRQFLRLGWARLHLPHQREEFPQLEAWNPRDPACHDIFHAVKPVPRGCAVCAAERWPERVRRATVLPALRGSFGNLRGRRHLLRCLGGVDAQDRWICARQGVRRGCRWMVSQYLHADTAG